MYIEKCYLICNKWLPVSTIDISLIRYKDINHKFADYDSLIQE